MLVVPRLRVARDILTPSFLRNADPIPRRPTSWLDGLRGWAALAVVLSHFCNNYFSSVTYGYGVPLHNGDRKPACNVPFGANSTHIVDETLIDNRHVMQLPILRLMVYGDPMVAIFFVVSGYSLSLKQIQLARQGTPSQSNLLRSLSSSIIRRPIRLFLPALLSSLLLALATAFGMTAYVDGILGETVRKAARKNHEESPFWIHFRGWIGEGPPVRLPSLSDQLWSWYGDMYSHMKPFSADIQYPDYDGHLWTIPIEYKCSMLLFATQLALAPVPSRKRLLLVTALSASALFWGGRWPMACFWAGMLLCELDMLPAPDPTTLGKQLGWIGAALVGAYLMSFPAIHPDLTPWSRPAWYLVHWLPGDHKRMLHAIGASVLTAAVSSHLWLSAFFSNGPSRYLGRISFAIYLVHGPMWRTLGHYLTLHFLPDDARTATQFQYRRACVASFSICFPLIVYLSDLFARTVDEPVIRFARRVHTCIARADEDDSIPEPELPLLPVTIDDASGDKRRDSVSTDGPGHLP